MRQAPSRSLTVTTPFLVALLAPSGPIEAAPRAAPHCVEPEPVRPTVRTAAPNEIELFMSFGTALSTDRGATWRLQCEEIYQDPGEKVGPSNQQITPDGTMVVAHFSGLLTSTDQGCSFRRATGLPTDSGGLVPAVLDVALDARDPDRSYWLIADDSLYRSDDSGATVTLVKAFPTHKVVRVVVSPSEGGVVYVQSFTSDASGFVTWIHSLVGGTWQSHTSPFGQEEISLQHVSPADPATIYYLRGVSNQRLYRSTDRGATAAMLFDARSTGATGFSARIHMTLGAQPQDMWIGISGGDETPGSSSLHHSADSGATWTRIEGSHPHFRCLLFMNGELWACGNNRLAAGDSFALGSSSDGGRSWTRRFALGELCAPISCGAAKCGPVLMDSCVPGICSPSTDGGMAPDARVETGGDGPSDGPANAGGGGGCSCRVAGTRPGGASLLLVLGVLVAIRRKCCSARRSQPRAGLM